eukprot:2306488-Amphidinium_carterae.1
MPKWQVCGKCGWWQHQRSGAQCLACGACKTPKWHGWQWPRQQPKPSPLTEQKPEPIAVAETNATLNKQDVLVALKRAETTLAAAQGNA